MRSPVLASTATQNKSYESYRMVARNNYYVLVFVSQFTTIVDATLREPNLMAHDEEKKIKFLQNDDYARNIWFLSDWTEPHAITSLVESENKSNRKNSVEKGAERHCHCTKSCELCVSFVNVAHSKLIQVRKINCRYRQQSHIHRNGKYVCVISPAFGTQTRKLKIRFS